MNGSCAAAFPEFANTMVPSAGVRAWPATWASCCANTTRAHATAAINNMEDLIVIAARVEIPRPDGPERDGQAALPAAVTRIAGFLGELTAVDIDDLCE